MTRREIPTVLDFIEVATGTELLTKSPEELHNSDNPVVRASAAFIEGNLAWFNLLKSMPDETFAETSDQFLNLPQHLVGEMQAYIQHRKSKIEKEGKDLGL